MNWMLRRRAAKLQAKRVNLGGGLQVVEGYCNVDVNPSADLRIDLEAYDLPFAPGSLDAVVCMSAINYLSRGRAEQVVNQVFEELKPGGIARFGVQDMKALAKRYVENDTDFFFQLGADGKPRFDGPTLGDKFATWFYGYFAGRSNCRYFYDYDSLAYLFTQAGFSVVERRAYQDSRLAEVALLDNRPDQMFYLEAVK